MAKNYTVTTNRTTLVHRIEELTGLRAEFTDMTHSAYRISDFTVTAYELTVDIITAETTGIIKVLIEEYLIDGDLIDIEIPEPAENTVNTTPDIVFPLSAHTGTSLRNLVNLIYSRGNLISKATGGNFGAEHGLIEVLKDETGNIDADRIRNTIREYEEDNGSSLIGISITDDSVMFTGFPEENHPDRLQSFRDLAELMNRQARTQKRIQAIIVDEENEKYSFRIWLVRTGMGGEEYKKSRKYLMNNLSGHTAFKDKEMAERWKERRIEKDSKVEEKRPDVILKFHNRNRRRLTRRRRV